MENINKLLREARHYRCLTAKELSNITGVSTSYITSVEKGLYPVNLEHLNKLKHALNLDINIDISYRRDRKL